MLHTALARAETLADCMVKGEDWVQGGNTSQALSSLLQRVPWRLMLPWSAKTYLERGRRPLQCLRTLRAHLPGEQHQN